MFKNILKNLTETFLFAQVNPLIHLSKLKNIEQSDVLELEEDVQNLKGFDTNCEINWSNISLFFKSFLWKIRKPLSINLLLLCIAQGLTLVSPLLVHRFVDSLTKGISSIDDFYPVATIGFMIGLLSYSSGLFLQHYFYQNLKLYQKLISLVNIKIFEQSLLIDHSSRQKISVGDVVNYMSSDSDSVADLPFIILEMLTNIFILLGSVGLLFYYLGPTAIVSIVLFLILIPITQKVANQFTHLDDQIMQFRDKRLNLMGQILNAIRLIKYFVWEKSVQEEVLAIREGEINARKKLVRADSFAYVIYMAVSSIVLLATLWTHHLQNKEINLATIFTLISIFSLLEDPFGNLTSLISRWSNAIVGIKRISEFSALSTKKIERVPLSEVSVTTNNLSFSYNDQFKLSNINTHLNSGKSLAIVGPVGSGKSTLLQLLLRELDPRDGSVLYSNNLGQQLRNELPTSTVFVPQESYIINSSLLENITFGSSNATEAQIQKALSLANFTEDLKKLEHGLYTEIGEKGINLSGGQKQRISLARAVLKNPDLILLDDPLSAVDIHTEDKLCDHLLFGEWKSKTRIVVTHRLEHLQRFDQILFIKNGKHEAYGSFADIYANSPEFIDFYNNYKKHELDIQTKNTDTEDIPKNNSVKNKVTNSHRVTEDEEKVVGAIKKDLYLSYIKLLGGESSKRKWVLVGLFVSAIVAKLFPLGQKAWLSELNHFSLQNLNWFFIGYSIISAVTLALCYFNNMLWFKQGIKAAVITHNKMLKSVLHANIRFFDSTPVGRILQRFSRDQESIDVHLMFTHITAIECLVQICISLVLIVTTLPLMLLFIAPVLVFFYWIQNDYRRVAREVKRFDSIARSPRFAHFKETLQGLTVLRAFGSQNWFKQEFWNRLSMSQKMFYNQYIVNRWFSIRVPLIGGFIASSSAVLLTWASYKGILSPGICGLVLIYAMSFWRQLNWAIRIFSEIEARMTSIERLQHYCELPQELESSHTQDPLHIHGHLEFRNLSVRYAKHLPLVLENISFKIKPGERVGVIGRTGSGKSTLFQALYRFVDFETGEILIDGYSIQNMSLTKLRRALAIIPQDPTLFLGTLRNNLDRYNEYSDYAIETVLKKVCMWNFISSLPDGLNTPVAENGNNFSQGQRQLLCLARALLTQAKIIILDEATASVDIQTDNLIQRILKEEMDGITQLIIAHRLETIKNCDQIIKLEKGKLTKVRESSNIEATDAICTVKVLDI